MLETWACLLIYIPLVVIVGLATSVIGFTGFYLVVPLALSVFGLSLSQSIFLSIMIDFADNAVLLCLYGRRKMVCWVIGIVTFAVMVVPAVSVGVVTVLYDDKMKGALSVLAGPTVIVVSIPFFVRGGKAMKKKPEPVEDIGKELDGTMSELLPEEASTEEEHAEKPLLPERPVYTLAIFKQRKCWTFIYFLFSLIFSVICGLMGISGGMFFVLILTFCLRMETLVATGTSAFTSSLLTFCLGILHAVALSVDGEWANNYYYLYPIVLVPLAMISTLLGARFALKLPVGPLNIFIGCVTSIAGILATVFSLID